MPQEHRLETSSENPATALAGADAFAALSVLVVDDTRLIRTMLHAFLTKLGHTVHFAEDGAQALAQFATQRPDLVLMDLVMPVMDGIEATRRIKANEAEHWAPVIFLSGMSETEQVVAGLQAGGDDYLAKPVNFDILDAKLRAFGRTISLMKERRRTEAVLVENAARLQQYHDLHVRQDELAAEVLSRMLHTGEISHPCLTYSVTAAEHASGDVVAAARAPDGRFFAMLADATGHGIAAAISLVPALDWFFATVRGGLALNAIVAEMNTRLRDAMPLGRFVAATLVCIDAKTRTGEIWIGGTPDAVLVDHRGRVVLRFSSRNFAFGVVADSAELGSPEAFEWHGPSELVMCSDGVIEAEDASNNAFGMERVLEALLATRDGTRHDAVIAALSSHLGARAVQDDASLAIIDLERAATAA